MSCTACFCLYSCQEISNAIVISCTNRWNPFIIDYAHGHGNIIFNRTNTSTTLYKYPLCKCSNMFIIVLINCTCCLSVTSQLTPAYMWKALCHQVEIGKLLHLGTCSTKSFGCHQCKSEEFTFTFKLMMTEALSWSISKEFFNVVVGNRTYFFIYSSFFYKKIQTPNHLTSCCPIACSICDCLRLAISLLCLLPLVNRHWWIMLAQHCAMPALVKPSYYTQAVLC